MFDLNRIISSAVKNGKFFFGSKQAINAAKSGRAVALIVASNCPPQILTQIQQHSMISQIPLYTYPAPSLDLGAVCRKPFAVSALVIREINDPDVIRMIRESGEASES